MKFVVELLLLYLEDIKRQNQNHSKRQRYIIKTCYFSVALFMSSSEEFFKKLSTIFIIIFSSLRDIKLMASKLKWSEQEQQILKKVEKMESKRKWVEIANQINALFPERQRTSKQCRQKYINHVQYSDGSDNTAWTQENEHSLFRDYLNLGSQWKIISKGLPGKSENAVKNKFYGKIRKLVRKLNNICRERINRSNKPLRDQSIMRIIDVKEGFENLPQHLVAESYDLKRELIGLAEKNLSEFENWDLVEQQGVVSLIKKIHRFNINSRYYCSRKRKSEFIKPTKKNNKQPQFNYTNSESDSLNLVEVKFQRSEKSVEQIQALKIIPIIPIIMPCRQPSQLIH